MNDNLTFVLICFMILIFALGIQSCVNQPPISAYESDYEKCIDKCPTTKYKFTNLKCPKMCAELVVCSQLNELKENE